MLLSLRWRFHNSLGVVGVVSEQTITLLCEACTVNIILWICCASHTPAWSLWRGLQTYYSHTLLCEALTLDTKLLETHTVWSLEGSAGAVSMQTDNRSIPRSPFLDGRWNIFSLLNGSLCRFLGYIWHGDWSAVERSMRLANPAWLCDFLQNE